MYIKKKNNYLKKNSSYKFHILGSNFKLELKKISLDQFSKFSEIISIINSKFYLKKY